MTFIEFKKLLLDAEITLPKFCKLIKVSDKNIQSYNQTGPVPNAIAAIAACFVRLHQEQIDYRSLIEELNLKKKTKSGGFKKKPLKKGPAAPTPEEKDQSDHDAEENTNGK